MSSPAASSSPSAETLDLLALTLVPGLGPVLIGRAVRQLGSVRAVLEATPAHLRTVPGLGDKRAEAMISARRTAREAALREVDAAAASGAHILGLNDPGYPPLLREINDPPPVLYVRGSLRGDSDDRYALAIVGSRACTQYGREQTARFAGLIGGSGITIISGGARGIDTSAHRAAIQAGGRTIAVLGCGIARAYPPENRDLFDQIASGHGAVISELPVNAHPDAQNFPARNRLITGMSLGVLVIEAARGSGSLISARLAVEDQNREVFAVPGRVDSPASEGVNDLLKSGSAALVTSPADVLEALRTPAEHAHAGTHEARFGATLFEPPSPSAPSRTNLGLSPIQQQIVEALDEPRDLDGIVQRTGLAPAAIAAEIVMLEIRRVVVRSAGKVERVNA